MSYINSVEAFQVGEFPARLSQITVATIWRKEAGDKKVDMRIRVSGPVDEEEPVSIEIEQEFGAFKRYRINRGIMGLPVEEPGTLTFSIEHREGEDWEVRKQIPVEIEEGPVQQTNGHPPTA